MPLQLEEYVHRIGRTGRAGEQGQACSFMTPENANLGPGLIKLLEEAKQEVPTELPDLIAGRGKFAFGKGGGKGVFGGKGGGKGMMGYQGWGYR